MTLTLALDHRFPRGVDEALGSVGGLRLMAASDDVTLREALREADALATFRWQDWFLTPGLRWIQSISAGVDQFPVTRIAEAGVVLTSARGVHAVQVSEHAFALLLALTRNIGISMRDTQSKTWRPRMGHELTGSTLGVLGLGAIGEEIARRAVAWGMTVVGSKARPESYTGVAREVFGPDSMVEVFRRSNAIVSVLPGGRHTERVVGGRELAALGRGWFVNVGRGSTVDIEALLDALDNGELLGAGLDVFEEEPMQEDSPLWTHPRVVTTPHIAGLSPQYGPRLAAITESNMRALRGEGEWVNRIV